MEKLISDIKILLMHQLHSRDIGRLAQTSKTMYKIFYGDRFIPFWKDRIFREFRIEYRGDDAFVTYKFYERKNRKCRYIMSKGRYQGRSCHNKILGDGTLGSSRYCRECLQKVNVQQTLKRKQAHNMR